MGKIYVNQTHLTVIIDCGEDAKLSDASSVVIRSLKPPDGAVGYEWAATITDVDNNIVEFTVTDLKLFDVVGQWKLWAYVEYNDGSNAPGEFSLVQIYAEGE